MRLAIEIVIGDAPVSYWELFSPASSNNPRSLCDSQLDPVPFWFLKWR